MVAASSPEAVEAARIEFLGQKQGKLKAAQERLRYLDPAGKRVYGQRFNGVKQSLEAALALRDRGWNAVRWPPEHSMSRCRESAPDRAIVTPSPRPPTS